MVAKANTRPRRFTILSCAVLLLAAVRLPAGGDVSTNVLVVNSYHHGFQWTDNQVSEFSHVLREEFPNALLFNEFMDAKRLSITPELATGLAGLLQMKYRDHAPGLVYATDDLALDFALEHCRRLWPQVPVVASGINRRDVPLARALGNVRIAFEVNEGAETVDFALRAHPQARRVVVIRDATDVATAISSGVVAHLRKSTSLPIQVTEPMPFRELLKQLRASPPDTLFILALFIQDSEGKFFNTHEVADAVADAAPGPVYVTHELHFHGGVVGGKVHQGNVHGANAGRLAVEMLKGEDRPGESGAAEVGKPATTPPDSQWVFDDLAQMRMGADRRVTQASAGAGYQSIQVAPSQWYFNEGALNRYGIARSNLPEDAVIVGEPGSLIDRHPVSFALAFVGVAAQTALIVYLLLNIRKRREITFTLRQREEQLQRLIEHSPMAACITDAESRIVYINQRHFQTFGYTLEEIDEPEKAARRFFPDAHERAKVLEDWKTEFERAQNEGRDPAPQVRNITCKDGRTLVVEFYYTLIGKQGFGILIDITERTRAVAELERVSKAAQAASEAKSQFLANVSHEIRTPMNGVLGMAQLLLETDPTPDQREYIDTIRDSSHLLLTIINDLLDLSKIEAGQMALDQRPVDTRTFIEGIAGLVESNMQQKGLDFAVELEHTVPQAFRCDPNRLSQVLLNLLNNALKFTDAGLVRLYVSSRDLGRYRGELMFRVVDSGIGIAPEQLERIFLPFNQGDTSTTRKYGGTGLGLTISRRLVEMMGGKLSVVSTPGKGSEFRFTIQVDIVPAVAAVKLEERIDGNLSHRYPLRILVAEDNPVNQKVALMVLQKMGYAADLAGNGVEAIEKLREHRYDVVLMDVQMPVMDGLTAVRKIRCEFPRDRQPQVIALTAHAMNDDIQRCREAGMDGYLSKPLRVPKLGEALVKAYEALVPMA